MFDSAKSVVGRRERSAPGVCTWLWLSLSLALAMFGCDGSSGHQSVDDTATAERGNVDPDVSVDKGQERIYGLPLPPDVDRLERTDTMVEVETPLSVDQLQSYYERTLTDYEIFKLGEGTLEIVGLRSFMPAIRAHQVGPLTTMTYVPSREPPDPKAVPDAGSATEASAGSASASRGRRDLESRILLGPGAGTAPGGGPDREPGTPVEVRTEDGELLAPGARWGEPYTPPPDSPLHKERFRSNFGLPFGEWHMD